MLTHKAVVKTYDVISWKRVIEKTNRLIIVFNDCIYLMINYSFVFQSRFLLILYICIYFANGRPLENQLAEWATVLKQLKLL